MSEERMENVEQVGLTGNLVSAIDEKGIEISALSGSIMQIQHHSLSFRETGQSFVSKRKTITPPSGWRRVSVSVSEWNLSYGHDVYERALVSHMAALAGVSLSGTTLEVIATALVREPTSAAGRKWAGSVGIQAIFMK